MALYKRHQLGQTAEQIASVYLQDKGFILIEKNYHCRQGEIDLIMQDKKQIVFVEVRCRKGSAYGNALESITPFKTKKIIRAATHFLQVKKWLYKVSSRFDIIVIHPIQGEMRLQWLKNAFPAE